MNLWGHRFFQNANQIFLRFLPYPLRDHSIITSSKRWVGGVRKWQFLMIYSTVNHQRVGWVGLKMSKPWWRNTWMPPKGDLISESFSKLKSPEMGAKSRHCTDVCFPISFPVDSLLERKLGKMHLCALSTVDHLKLSLPPFMILKKGPHLKTRIPGRKTNGFSYDCDWLLLSLIFSLFKIKWRTYSP